MDPDIRTLVLALLTNAKEPLTTSQIKSRLDIKPVARDIYAVLLTLQSSGQVECTLSCPWKWSRAPQAGS